MLAFNRMGLHWSGMQKGLVTNFLRDECGMTGIVVTDMWYGNNGRAEGCVNKIKRMKHSMYGRASFLTLRTKILLEQKWRAFN